MPVQMSKEEEELVRELLWTLVNNHVFFQHPDLIRILKIHENVIAIIMNSIARSEGGGGGGGRSVRRTEQRPRYSRLMSLTRKLPRRADLNDCEGLSLIVILL